MVHERHTPAIGAKKEIRALELIGSDPYVWISSAGAGLAATLGLSQGGARGGFMAGCVSIVLLAVALTALKGSLQQHDGYVWRNLVIAYTVWLAGEVAQILGGVLHVTRASGLAMDLAYFGSAYFVFVALSDLSLVDQYGMLRSRHVRVVTRLAAASLFLGTAVYFVVIPVWYAAWPYHASVSSVLARSLLDVTVMMAAFVGAATFRQTRYRMFGRLLGLAFLGWGCFDLLRVAGLREGFPAGRETWAGLLWFLAYVPAIAANRVWRWPVFESWEPQLGSRAHGGSAVPFSRTVVFVPFLLVVSHFVGYRLHFLSPACRVPRDVTVMFVVLMAALTLMVQSVVARTDDRLRALVEDAPEAIVIADAGSGHVIHSNPQASSLLGYTRGELSRMRLPDLGRRPSAESADEGAWPIGQELRDGDEEDQSQLFEWTVVAKDGREIPCEVHVSRIPQTAGYLRVSIFDMSERKKLEAEMRKLSQALTQTSDLVIITDAHGIIQWVNDGFTKISGYSREEAIGATPRLLNSGRHDRSFFKDLWETIRRGDDYHGILINRRKDGSIYYDERTITPLRDASGRITSYIATGREVKGRSKDQARLQHLASHDILTDLPNRALFFEKAVHTLLTARRHRRRFAIVFVDIDDFKTINDSLGHGAGDAVLKAVARRLTDLVRVEDTVSRFGGDEFVVLADEIANRDEAAVLAERLCRMSRTPVEIGDRELNISISSGIALFPDDGTTLEDLVRRADLAMYEAKRRQPGSYRFYSPRMRVAPKERLLIRQLVAGAADRGELSVMFQPCFDLRTGRVACFEALLRWHSRELGDVSPERFIPIAESSGAIVALGEWVLEEACRHAAGWPVIHGSRPGVSVNVASPQLEQSDFMDRVAAILERTSLPPWDLTLELTERLLIEDSAEVLRALGDFATMGIELSIDDFGTGYSSMSYLDRFHAKSIKIDRSFIEKVDETSSVPAMIDAIIKMAHANGSKVVAEGVELPIQLGLLRKLGCDMCQGFLLCRPLRADAVVPFLKNNALHPVQFPGASD